jgi:hypothetical protein
MQNRRFDIGNRMLESQAECINFVGENKFELESYAGGWISNNLDLSPLWLYE